MTAVMDDNEVLGKLFIIKTYYFYMEQINIACELFLNFKS